jgi:hypothetical protein
MSSEDSSVDEISFSKKVDSEGRLVIPQAHRRALGIDNEEAIVEFDAHVLTVFDETETDKDRKEDSDMNLTMAGPSAAAAWVAGQACTVGQKAIKTYAVAKHKALANDPRHPYYPLNQMPFHRKMGLISGYAIILITASSLTYWTGDLAAITRGDAFTTFGVVLGLIFGFILFSRSLPSVAETSYLNNSRAAFSMIREIL